MTGIEHHHTNAVAVLLFGMSTIAERQEEHKKSQNVSRAHF